MDNKLIYVDVEGKHEVTIENFVKDKSFDEIMKCINRDEDSFSKLKEYKRLTNDYAMYKLLEYFYHKCNDLANTKNKVEIKVEDEPKKTDLNEKVIGVNEFVELDNMGSFAENMKM